MPPRLTSTSYALLGLLDLRPFSAYELTKYMQRSALSRLWPRTEASVYKEAKALVGAGLARARVRTKGRRARTEYEITPPGRAAFREWLRSPAEGITFECEAAVKAFFGHAGDLDTLRSHLRSLVDRYEAEVAGHSRIAEGWLAGQLEFPERLQYTAMAATLIGQVERAVGEWARAWLGTIKQWEDTALHPTSEAHARAVLEEMVRSTAIGEH